MTIKELEQKRNNRKTELLNRFPAVKAQLRDQLQNKVIADAWKAYLQAKGVYEKNAQTLKQKYGSSAQAGRKYFKAVNKVNQIHSELTAKYNYYLSLVQQRANLYRSIKTLSDQDIMAIILEKLTKYGGFAISVPELEIKTKGYFECGYIEDSIHDSGGNSNPDFLDQLHRAIDVLLNEGIILVSEEEGSGYINLSLAKVIPGNYIISNIGIEECAKEVLKYFFCAIDDFAYASKPALVNAMILSVANQNNFEEKFVSQILDFLVNEQALNIRTEETVTYGAYQKKNVIVTRYLEKGSVDFEAKLREEQEYRKHQIEKQKKIAGTIAETDLMEGHEFEYWCADLLRKVGFTEVSVTQGSGDQGVDVLAAKDGVRYAIQCKCYSSNLSNTPVQEVHAGKSMYNCHVAVVMTNSHFTRGAEKLAQATGVLLWDRDKLKKMIEDAENTAGV